MNTIKSIAISLIVAAIVTGTGLGYALSRQQQSPIQATVKGASPDFSNSPYLTVGGVTEWYSVGQFENTNATTTLCAIAAPVASSTLQGVWVRFTAITPAKTGGFGTSTTPYRISGAALVATSTNVATGTGIGWIASAYNFISAGQYVVATINSTTTVPATGYCQAEFTQF